jgi:hypothetical protein
MKHALDYIWLSAGQMTNDHYDPDGGHIAYRGLR